MPQIALALAEAFAESPIPTGMASPLGREVMEDAGRLEALQGQRWQDMRQSDLEGLARLIPAMTVEAFVHSAPAFLRAALKAPESEAATSIFYALAPLGGFEAFLAGTCRLFTPPQAAVIADALEALAAEESFEMMAEEAGPAVALWRRRASETA